MDKYLLELDELSHLAETAHTDPNAATVETAITDIVDLAIGPANRSLRTGIDLSA
ncbi:hypothetical protein ACIRBX_01215 [Kitasatospora sp. NPDC096147]|uniref:hypothetical protein n=1 Tax=Kitasatospora sp. NPDC096147 TaxID=3364093 RepID=UPI0037F5D644